MSLPNWNCLGLKLSKYLLEITILPKFPPMLFMTLLLNKGTIDMVQILVSPGYKEYSIKVKGKVLHLTWISDKSPHLV